MVKLRDLRQCMMKRMPKRFPEIEKMIQTSERELEKTAFPYLMRVKHSLYVSDLNRQCRRR